MRFLSTTMREITHKRELVMLIVSLMFAQHQMDGFKHALFSEPPTDTMLLRSVQDLDEIAITYDLKRLIAFNLLRYSVNERKQILSDARRTHGNLRGFLSRISR